MTDALPESQVFDADTFISIFQPGDSDNGWPNELQYLWTSDQPRTLALLDEVISAGGINKPVSVGPDKRVWDGHHRVAIALALRIPLPVEFVK